MSAILLDMQAALLSPSQVSDLLGVPVATLYAWRYRGDGPEAIKIGRHLRYRPADIERWLQERAGGDRRSGG
jgi:predicted DNA-binding transcriptional regulator AlpA